MYAPYEGPDTLYGRGIEQVLNFSSVADPDLGSGDFPWIRMRALE
jgi:hypothetical protein